jgi:hypothetical protein
VPPAEPAEPFLGEDLADAGAVEHDALGGERGADLIHRQAAPAQRDDAGAGGVLARCALGAGLAGRREELERAGAEFPVEVDHRPAGVAEPRAGHREGEPVDVVGAQCLVAAPVHLVRGGEELRPALLR